MGLLFAVVAAFGENGKCPPPKKNMNQGDQLIPDQYLGTYNIPARIDVRNDWDFYGTASFTYWQPIQENMEPAQVGTSSGAGNDLDIVNMNFEYKPGFKLGFGMSLDHDNWDGYAQYTWFRGTSSTSPTVLETVLVPVAGTVVVYPYYGNTEGYNYFTASQSWRLQMDFADLELARSYYNGASLTLRPFCGVRAAWIRQYLNSLYEGTDGTDSVENKIKQNTNSWGIGPRAGIYGNWLLGEGLRIYGNGGGDILYTRYTKLGLKQTRSVGGFRNLAMQRDFGTLRAHLELELGLGWGTYFDNNNWHVDLSADYGFQVFFNQNMFRAHGSTPGNDIDLTYNNLYIHGMTATARLDF